MTKRDRANRENKRLRQVALLNNLFMGSSITKVVRKARYSKKWPGQAEYRALQDLKLKTPELLERLGLGRGVLIEKYLEPLLNARKVKFFQHKGKVTDKRVVPDNDLRLKALEMALESNEAPTDRKLEEAKGVHVILVDIPLPGFPNGRPLPAGVDTQLPAPENRS